MARIAIVDDDPEWGTLLLELISSSGHDATHYPTAGRFFDSLHQNKPDLAVLDMQLPGMHGREVIRILRANSETRNILIVAVSAHDTQSEHAILAFEAGADEYLTKPVDSALLKVRLDALLRRRGRSIEEHGERINVGPLVILPQERSAMLRGQPLRLTNLEFELLTAFARQPDRVLTRGLILQNVWKASPDMNTRTVDKHVESLRRKMGDFGKNLETVVSVGYVLKIGSEEA